MIVAKGNFQKSLACFSNEGIVEAGGEAAARQAVFFPITDENTPCCPSLLEGSALLTEQRSKPHMSFAEKRSPLGKPQ